MTILCEIALVFLIIATLPYVIPVLFCVLVTVVVALLAFLAAICGGVAGLMRKPKADKPK